MLKGPRSRFPSKEQLQCPPGDLRRPRSDALDLVSRWLLNIVPFSAS